VKRCSKCREEKALGEFAAHKTSAGGVDSSCRACKREYDRAYRASSPTLAARQRAYYFANRERIISNVRKYRETHWDEVTEQQRAYGDVHKDRRRENNREWHAAHRSEVANKNRAKSDATRANATHHGTRWSSSEDAIVLRDTESPMEVAFILQRTYDSVLNRRRRLRRTA
jgi:hypothetical protein